MKRGRTFVITQRKGGVGKTTLAMNLAIYLRQIGGEVAFLDLDPQRDGFEFFRERALVHPNLPSIPHMALEDPDQVERAMRTLTLAGADGVVDCPPLDPPQVIRAQEVADILVFPFKAGGNDLRAFSRALSLYQAKTERTEWAATGKPLIFGLLNEFMRSQLNDRLLLKWLQGAGVFRAAGCLGRRIEFKDAIAMRQSVWEYAPDSLSARETLAACETLHRSGE
jgi:chromosome partitioning protein